MCFKYIKNENVFAKHRKIKEDINNKRFILVDTSTSTRTSNLNLSDSCHICMINGSIIYIGLHGKYLKPYHLIT
jgi:hypothetical protein